MNLCLEVWKFFCEDNGAYSVENFLFKGHRLVNFGGLTAGTYASGKYDDQVNLIFIISESLVTYENEKL